MNAPDRGRVIAPPVAAPHAAEDGIVSALQGDVEMAAELGRGRGVVDKRPADVGRLHRVETDALEAVDGVELLQQGHQGARAAAVAAVAPGVDTGEGELAVPGLHHLPRLAHHLDRGPADSLSAHRRDYAVGAVLVAAVLDLQGAAGAAPGYDSFDFEEAAARCPPGWRPRLLAGEVALHQLQELGLAVVAEHQVSPGCGEVAGAPLGVTAGGHHRGPRVPAPCPAHRLARIGVARSGNGAGIYHADVRFPVPDHGVPAAVESVLQRLEFVLVQLAADVREGNPQGPVKAAVNSAHSLLQRCDLQSIS